MSSHIPNKRKLKKIPITLRLLLIWYKVLEVIYPKAALKLAIRFFFTSFRTSRTASQKVLEKSAEKSHIVIKGIKVNVYRWGNGTKKAILVHGWSGYALQFEEFIKTLLSRDYTIISFDAVAHGRSQGSTTNLLDFIEIIETLMSQEGEIDLLLGHSFGGVAISHFAFEKNISKLGIISSPSSSDIVLQAFQDKVGVSDKILTLVLLHIKNKFGQELSTFFPEALFRDRQPDKPILLIHDETDREFPLEEHYALKTLFANPSYYVSNGLGHTRLLFSPEVIKKFNEFI